MALIVVDGAARKCAAPLERSTVRGRSHKRRTASRRATSADGRTTQFHKTKRGEVMTSPLYFDLFPLEARCKMTPHIETRVMIAGSRYSTRPALDYARRVVQRAHTLGWTIVVGDNPRGVDMAVVHECRRLKAKVVVVGIAPYPRNGGCAHGSYLRAERDLYRAAGGQWLDRYHARDRRMVDMCQRAVFIWNGDSPGTKAGYDYALLRGKEAHLVTFPVKGVWIDG
jgi:hypothetical protein